MVKSKFNVGDCIILNDKFDKDWVVSILDNSDYKMYKLISLRPSSTPFELKKTFIDKKWRRISKIERALLKIECG